MPAPDERCRSVLLPAVRIALLMAAAALAAVSPAFGQRPDESAAEREERMARRGGGVRVGTWNVGNETRADASVSHSPQIEVFLQRGLDERMVLENSAGVWRRLTRERQQLPTGSDTVETRAYVIPLLTSLRFYPFSTPADRLEPFILGGLGLAAGVEDQSRNAIGGGGITIVTGFGIRAAAGLELYVGRGLSVTGDARYQWLKLSEEVDGTSSFYGPGLDGGLTFRFTF